ncbi:MAG TPA: magnesium transporter CorA family protein [archaeon]|nr:magnesium transporter CorA family protein [archaeon]
MIDIYFKKYGSNELEVLKSPLAGCWINIVDPNPGELKEISTNFDIPVEFLHASLDEDEQARFDHDDASGTVLVILKVPDKGKDEIEPATLGVILNKKYIFTVSKVETKVIHALAQGPKNFYTTKQTRALLQLMWFVVEAYISHLDEIDRKTNALSDQIRYSLGNDEVFRLLAIQKTLTYFKSATQGNQKLLQKISGGKHLKLYEADAEFLDDIVVENNQAIILIDTYLDILTNTMDAHASIVSNNLNVIMKVLTVVNIVMAIPMIVSGFYGMNVIIPFQNHPMAFLFTILLGFIPAVLVLIILHKIRWI